MLKSKKKIFTILASLCLIFALSSSSLSVQASANFDTPAQESIAEFVEENTAPLDNSRTPLDTIYFSISEDGEFHPQTGDSSTYAAVEDVIIGSYTFYDDGSKNGKHYYEVQMRASTIDKRDYFTFSSLSCKPENNSKYLSASKATYPSYLKKTSISDAKQYYYDGSGPSSPYVWVKSSYTINGTTDYSIPAKKLTKPIK